MASTQTALRDPKLGSISSLRCQITRMPRSVWISEMRMVSRGRRSRCRYQTTWWSQTGSNRRPHACKARALPAELWPRNQKTNAHSIKVVGLGRLELPTSRLSSARSNQLSYKPLTLIQQRIRNPLARNRLTPMHRTALKPLGACSSAKKEKRRRRNPAYGAR
jgi:hypothetical protein